MTEPSLHRTIPLSATVALLAALAVAGCAGGTDPATTAARTSAMLEPAVLQRGDVSLRASVLPTSNLNATMAAQYGITPDDSEVLLLVGLRTGPESDERSLPATVTASATDLRGLRRDIALREIRSGDFVDYIGTTRAIAPETLRFDVSAQAADAAPLTLDFTRDFLPR